MQGKNNKMLSLKQILSSGKKLSVGAIIAVMLSGCPGEDAARHSGSIGQGREHQDVAKRSNHYSSTTQNNEGGKHQDVAKVSGKGKIVFSSDRTGNYEIFSYSVKNGGLERLTFNPGYDDYPAVSPDGTKIVFNRSTNSLDLYIMNSDGSDQRFVMKDAWFPVWTKDSKILYRTKDNVFYMTNPKGTSKEKLTDKIQGRRIHGLISFDISPDNQKIVLDQFNVHTGSWDVHMLSIKSGRNERIIEGAYDPSFSYDGRQLAFAMYQEGEGMGIYIADGNGRNPRKVIGPFGDETIRDQPRFSPDGKNIVYASNKDGDFELYVFNLGTGSEVKITDHPAGDMMPYWSN